MLPGCTIEIPLQISKGLLGNVSSNVIDFPYTLWPKECNYVQSLGHKVQGKSTTLLSPLWGGVRVELTLYIPTR